MWFEFNSDQGSIITKLSLETIELDFWTHIECAYVQQNFIFHLKPPIIDIKIYCLRVTKKTCNNSGGGGVLAQVKS